MKQDGNGKVATVQMEKMHILTRHDADVPNHDAIKNRKRKKKRKKRKRKRKRKRKICYIKAINLLALHCSHCCQSNQSASIHQSIQSACIAAQQCKQSIIYNAKDLDVQMDAMQN